MKNIRHYVRVSAALVLLLLSLTACAVQPQASSATPLATSALAAQSVSLTQQGNADDQAAATAEVERGNALATLNSANATISAVQTQDQSDADVIAAQIAAVAEIARANAQATLSAAGSTQGAALTQDAIRQTQMADIATSGAQAVINQQDQDALAASTQTAVADNIATQTQAAEATSEWYADRARQRDEARNDGPIPFMWLVCLQVFLVLATGWVLWAFWRWLKIRQGDQLHLESPVDNIQAPMGEVLPHHHHDPLPYLEHEVRGSGYQVTKPDDQVRGWLDEVKRKLLSSDRKESDDHTDD